MEAVSNGELVRRGFLCWNDRDWDGLLEYFHEDAVWDMRPFGVPDMAVFHGHSGLRRFFSDWLAAFPEATTQVDDVDEVGDWTLSYVLQIVSGGASGAPVPFRYGGVGHWRDGRLDFVENHPDLEKAREALHRYATSPAPQPATR